MQIVVSHQLNQIVQFLIIEELIPTDRAQIKIQMEIIMQELDFILKELKSKKS